jgi:putative transposase
MKKPTFVNGNFYHVYNRGVEKRTTFLDDQDYQRFLHDVYEFNDTAAAGRFSLSQSERAIYAQLSEVQPPKVRDVVVNIHAFCLMPNHFHLLLEQVQDDGIVLFMKKLGGYTMYFNEKHDRVGPLFQGRYKAKHIDSDPYLTHVSRYIHLNPLGIVDPLWKEHVLAQSANTSTQLAAYKWSSYSDYIDQPNYPSLLKKDLIRSLVAGNSARDSLAEKYSEFTMSWVHGDEHFDYLG